MHKIIISVFHEFVLGLASLHTEILALRQQVVVLKLYWPGHRFGKQKGFSGSSCLTYGLAGVTPW